MNSKIDWNGKLEVVCDDGRVLPVDRRDTTKHSDFQWLVQIEGSPIVVVADTGFTGIGYTIRNVAPKEVEWGPEIKVEGKRPEWLWGDELVQVRWLHGDIDEHVTKYICGWGRAVEAIRLPANHPHYTKPTRTALEHLDRMEALVRRMAEANADSKYTLLTGLPVAEYNKWGREARAIVAELPEVVDPDVDAIAEALALVDRVKWEDVQEGVSPYHEAGLYREDYRAYAKAAIKRGRALERGE